MKLILTITEASGTNLAKKIIEYLPNDIDLNYKFAYNNMEVVYFYLKEIDKTIELYTKVLQINPDNYKVQQKKLDLILNHTNYKSLN